MHLLAAVFFTIIKFHEIRVVKWRYGDWLEVSTPLSKPAGWPRPHIVISLWTLKIKCSGLKLSAMFLFCDAHADLKMQLFPYWSCMLFSGYLYNFPINNKHCFTLLFALEVACLIFLLHGWGIQGGGALWSLHWGLNWWSPASQPSLQRTEPRPPPPTHRGFDHKDWNSLVNEEF